MQRILQVEAARRELLEQLGPERAAKLRQRAAQKEEQAAKKRAASQQQQEQQRGATDKTLPSAEAAKPKGTQQGTWNAPNQAHDALPHPTGMSSMTGHYCFICAAFSPAVEWHTCHFLSDRARALPALLGIFFETLACPTCLGYKWIHGVGACRRHVQQEDSVTCPLLFQQYWCAGAR